MVLGDAHSGMKVRIIRFKDNRGLEGKLRQLGILPGDAAKIIRQAPFDGPFLLEIRGREIALGSRIAEGIVVEEIE
ncbi:MAG TPA: FeoA family protein [Anaerolineaceae bacterium]|nr:FeoA family protein [Anaerolineaceae bacterium]